MSESTRILWVSNYQPLPIQEKELDKLFNEVEVVHKDLRNSEKVKDEFEEGNYADLVCVVPMATLSHILDEGLYPLWAEMSEDQIGDREPDLNYGQPLWFEKFQRVTSLELCTQQVEEKTACDIIRITRHPASTNEIEELEKLFGPVLIADYRKGFEDAEEVLKIYNEKSSDHSAELLLVAPYSVYGDLCNKGMNPLRAEYEEGRFQRIVRIIGIEFEKQDL